MPIKKVRPNPIGHGFIDTYTGKFYDGIAVIIGKKRYPYTQGWIMNSQEALEIVAKDRDLRGEIVFRVLLFVCARLDFENWVQVTLKEIADELGIYKPDVSKAIKALEKKEIILRGPKFGRSYAFRLNPHYGWKGKVTNLEDYRRQEWDDQNKNIESLTNEKKTSQTSYKQLTKKVTKHSSEVNQLSQQFDIPTEKLEKLLSYFQNTQDRPI